MLLKATKQWPKGYDDLYANKDNPEILKQLMEEKNIQMMIHVE
jgi:HKD family nuclease